MIWLPLTLDHDFFTQGEGKPPYYRIVEPNPAPDSVVVTGEGLTVPVGRAARTVYIQTAGAGGLDAKGIAADGELRFVDGRTQALKWMVGEQIWPAWTGASGRGADAVIVGKNPGGDVLSASLLTVPVSWPDAPIESVTIRARGGGIPMVLMGVAVADTEPTTQQLARAPAMEGFAFPIPSTLAGLYTGPRNELPGFLQARDHLYWPDGRRARFWGVNLVGKAALPEDPVAEAAGLASFGFNMVRLHHIDDESTLVEGSGIDPVMLDRFDRFQAELGKAGIAVFAEMWTKRAFRNGEGVPDPENVPVGNKYVGYVEPEWREAQKKWFAGLYGRVNPYTGKAYVDDPTIAIVELSNENSLVVAWNGGALEKLPAPHRDKLDARWNQWLRARYKTDGALNAAWSGASRGGLQLGETLDLASVAREPAQRNRTELYPARRAADLLAFYQELERDYFRDMSTFVRGMGFKVPIVCTTSQGVPLADAQLGACDVIDLHVYWDAAPEATVFQDTSLLDRPGRWLDRLAGCQVGKPCTVSELNHTFPNRKQQEAPLFWAVLAGRQDWDAVLWFAWSHAAWRSAPDGPEGGLDLEGRASFLAQMPTAAKLFRGGVEAATGAYSRWWSEDGLYRDLAEAGSLWLDPIVSPASWMRSRIRSTFVPVAETALGADSPFVWEDGTLRGTSGDVSVVIGNGEAGPLKVALTSYAAVSFDAGTGLLTLVGREERDGTLWSDGAPSPLVLGKGPSRLERLRGWIWVDGMKRAEWLRADGTVGGRVRVKRGGVEVGEVPSAWVRVGR